MELMSLPNELLAHVLGGCPTIRTLWNFSRVNRRLRAIWLTHIEQIVGEVYNHKIPNFHDAVGFTLAEVQLRAQASSDVDD